LAKRVALAAAGVVEDAFYRAGANRAVGLADDGSRTRPLALAFSANLSQRSPKARRSAAICGELANFARRAHSAACARQYITYDDITRSQHTYGQRAAPHLGKFRAACGGHREYSCGVWRKTRG
jgi:hypothetical protein